MFKQLLSVLVLATLSLPLWGQHARRVLVEEFTQASCPPCAAQNPAFNRTLASRDSLVTAIKYQVWWPGYDPMYFQTASDVNPRVAYYEVTGVPNAYQNGKTEIPSPGSYSANQIDEAYNEGTPVAMTVTHTFNAAFDSVLVKVTVASDDALEGNLRLRVAVTESEINFTAAPGTNGEREFFQVMRKMLPDAEGTETGTFKAGETKTYEFAWKMRNFYDLNQIEVAAWLQDDDTKEAWQSAVSKPNTTFPGGNFARVTLSATSGFRLTCDPSTVPSFTLKNLGTTPLTELKGTYSLDGSAPEPFTWTGSINPNLTTNVVLSAVQFTDPGFHTIDISVKETNQGPITNQVESAGTIRVNSMFEIAQLPIKNDFETEDFPSKGWGLRNEVAGDGWSVSSRASGFGRSTKSLTNNYFDIPNGKTTEFYIPRLDFTGVGSAKLSFSHAYARYDGTTNDRLRIYASSTCNTGWATLFDKAGTALATAPDKTTRFVPTATQWKANEIDLTSYAGKDNVLVRFSATSAYGNDLYLDDINISSVSGTFTALDLKTAVLAPNPAREMSELSFELAKAETIMLQVFDQSGRLMHSKNLGDLPAGAHVTPLDASVLTAGAYRVVLQGKEGTATLQWLVAR